ncbi:kinase-like domain-containing protein [Phanerochaete sordida]|uniref:Kinase-like domain-containing protein n=1 Tax=Phanerochaete sordida TaxID=48140 RepID=A0A9P3L953_9APHY|nr:kinase-like domain-containing protein [Phanerochaete sordida]
MPTDTRTLCLAAATAAAAAIAVSTLWRKRPTFETEGAPRKSLVRACIPSDLRTWRRPGEDEHADNEIWANLHSLFAQHGYVLWSHKLFFALVPPPGQEASCNGFGYATSFRDVETFYDYTKWEYNNAISRAARSRTGHDVVVRVLVVGDQGRRHLNILRKIARGSQSLFSNNHTLPMLDELAFNDIIFGIFPKSGIAMNFAYGHWATNSVGDILDMIMQALEGLTYLHSMNIAHRDVFKSNFMVEWMPESLCSGAISPSRPQVYMIDFECAVEFSADSLPDERRCIGIPLGDTMEVDEYLRPVPPEVASGMPYDPFKLDVWQLGTDLADFKSTIQPIDEALSNMAKPDVSARPSAAETLQTLCRVLEDTPPNALLIKPLLQEC